MKKTFYPAIAILYAVVIVLSCSTLKAQTYRILPLGNSITDGITQSNDPPESVRIAYRRELFNLLNNGGHSFDFVGHNRTGYNLLSDADNGGIPGTRGSYIVRLLQDGYDIRWGEQTTTGGQPYLDEYPADIILLHIGTNDIIPTGADASAIGDILDEIDAWEARTGTHVTVFIARIINKNPYSPIITEYNNHLLSIVSSRGDPSNILVDMENGAGINYSTEMGSDGVHPTQVAYDKIGQTWYISLNSFLSNIPAPPDGLSSSVGATSINLTWNDNSTNEFGFEIERSETSAGGSFTLIHTTSANANSFTDNGLIENTRYYYRIRAINASGPSLYSDIKSFTTTPVSMEVPTELSVDQVDAFSVTLSWADNTDIETGYTIERSANSGSGFAEIHTTSANITSFTDQGLEDGTEYFYRIRATDGINHSEYSEVVSALTILASPSEIVVSTLNEWSILLSWTDNSDSESHYVIERSLSFDSDFEVIHTTPADETYYLDNDLKDGTEYFYRIKAGSDITNSTYSDEVSAITPLMSPTGLQTLPANESSILLVWSDLSASESGFIVERSISSGSDYKEVHELPANEESYQDSGLTDGTLYYYRVRAINDLVKSNYSHEVSAATILASPSKLQASKVDEDAISLSWSDNSESETAYSIDRSTNSESGFSEIHTTPADENSYEDTGLDEGTEYFYRVRAIKGQDHSSYTNISSAIIELKAPTGLEAISINEGSISLTWIDNSKSETAYLIERSEEAEEAFMEIAATTANFTSYTDKEINNVSQYIYRVRATNGVLLSAYSNEVHTSQDIPLSDSLFSFYPNPNNGIITIVISKGEEDGSDGYIRLADFSGRVHFFEEIELSDGRQVVVYEIQLPSTVENGIYSLSLITGTSSVSQKFILIR